MCRWLGVVPQQSSWINWTLELVLWYVADSHSDNQSVKVHGKNLSQQVRQRIQDLLQRGWTIDVSVSWSTPWRRCSHWSLWRYENIEDMLMGLLVQKTLIVPLTSVTWRKQFVSFVLLFISSLFSPLISLPALPPPPSHFLFFNLLSNDSPVASCGVKSFDEKVGESSVRREVVTVARDDTHLSR